MTCDNQAIDLMAECSLFVELHCAFLCGIFKNGTNEDAQGQASHLPCGPLHKKLVRIVFNLQRKRQAQLQGVWRPMIAEVQGCIQSSGSSKQPLRTRKRLFLPTGIKLKWAFASSRVRACALHVSQGQSNLSGMGLRSCNK